MNKKSFIITLFILCSLVCQSQSFKEMMMVRLHELKMKKYDKDTTANAVVLFEYGITSLNRKNLKITTDIQKKIKIFNKNGLDQGTVNVLLYGSADRGETLSELKAETHNIEDSLVVVTELKDDQIFVENYDGVSSIVKFTLPKVKAGSVITYSYKLTSPFIYNFKEWYFQEDIPKVTSEYLTSIPKDWKYNTQLIGNLKFSEAEKVATPKCISESYFKLGKTYCENVIYKMVDIPAFKSERFISSEDNYISKLDYELESVTLPEGKTIKISNNWELIDTQLQETSGDILKENRSLRKILPKEISKIIDKEDRAKAIYKFLVNNYSWNGDFRSRNKDYKSIKKEKTGSIFELNGLLYNLLALNEIEAYPMLISTRSNGLPTKLYPAVTDFNYLLTRIKINDEVILLDASDKYIPFGELPFRCLNQYGRVLDFEAVSYWEDVAIKDFALNQKNIKVTLEDDFVFKGELNSRLKGLTSHDVRKLYFENKENYLEAFRSALQNIDIVSHKINTKDKLSNEFSETIELGYELDFIDNKSYFNPFITKFFEENPFKLKERFYPTDFGYKEIYQYSINIDLNDKVKASDLPKSSTFSLPNKTGNVIFSCVKKDNTITVFLKIIFQKAIYGPKYYEVLKKFMAKIVEIQNNTIIVLEKK